MPAPLLAPLTFPLPQVLDLAVAGCRAVAAFMRQQLLEHTQALVAARGTGEPGGGGSGSGDEEADEGMY